MCVSVSAFYTYHEPPVLHRSFAAFTALNHASAGVPSSAQAHLLVVFDPHAERIDEDGDHDPPVKVFTLHNPLQLLSEADPGPNHPAPVFQDALPSAASSPASQIAALGNRWEGFIQQMYQF